MYLKPSLSSVLKLSVCLTISQFAGLSAMAQTKAIAAALKTKNSQKVAQYKVRTKQVSEPGSTSSFNERIRGGAIVRKKQQMDFLDLPNDGEFKYSLGIIGAQSISRTEVDSTGGKSKTEGKGESLSLQNIFAYGFNEIFSVNVGISYGQSNSEYNTTPATGLDTKDKNTSKGMNDPSLGLVLKLEGNNVTTIVKGTIDFKTQNSSTERKTEGPVTTSESNNTSGGSEFTPSVTIHTNSNPNIIFGTEFSYRIRNDRSRESLDKNTNTTTTSETGGGNIASLNLLTELKLAGGSSIGGALGLQRSEPLTFRGSTYRYEGSDMALVLAYSSIKASETFSIMPAVGYATSLQKERAGVTAVQDDTFIGLLRTTLSF